MFEVAEEDDLPVVVVERLHRGSEPAFQFAPGGGGGRRELTVGEAGGGVGGRVAVTPPSHQRHLTIDAPGGGHPMAAVRVDQTVAGHVPQPQLEGHGGIGEVVAEPAVGLEEDILDDVAGIDAALDAPIHPPIDHLPDRIAVAGEKAVDGIVVAAADAVEQDEGRLAILMGRAAGVASLFGLDRKARLGLRVAIGQGCRHPGGTCVGGSSASVAGGDVHSVPSLPQSYQRVSWRIVGRGAGFF